LEVEIAAPTAEVSRILAFVQELPSPTVAAPRNLSATLRRRLEEIATANGGRVPMHGRLFSQWMHHAFPLECPYPHVTGTVNPQTPDEWMRQSGHEGHQVSEHEMRSYVIEANGVAARRFNIGEQDEVDVAELHWSDVEESFCGAGSAPPDTAKDAEAEQAAPTFNIREHDAEDALIPSFDAGQHATVGIDDLPWVDAEGRERSAQPPIRLSGRQIVAPPQRERVAMWRLGLLLALVTTCALGIVVLAPAAVLSVGSCSDSSITSQVICSDGKPKGRSYCRSLLLAIGGIKLCVLVAAADAHGWLDRGAFIGALVVGGAAASALAAVRMLAPLAPNTKACGDRECWA
jgi:hypothetical protein